MSKKAGGWVGCLTVFTVALVAAGFEGMEARRKSPRAPTTGPVQATSLADDSLVHDAPSAGAARLGGCTFDIECDDGNPCTVDTCSIAPGGSVGSGTCGHTNDGQPRGAVG